ncbi:response regulator [Oceanibium sediminis]|uniref:response regulator n=1 Tax=Oceanibium sediminis TaxID=2026339 RepID=UPI0013007CDA|nr:response regulator [Oceanibium sediminis]
MGVLLVQDNADLALIWARFLARRGFNVTTASTQTEAMRVLATAPFNTLIIDPALQDGGLPVADYATFRNPDIKILIVTRSSFFSEGMVFDLVPNARGVLRTPVRPGDLAAYLEYFGELRDAAPEQHKTRA